MAAGKSRQHARREKFHALNQEYDRLSKEGTKIRPLAPIWMTAAAAAVLVNQLYYDEPIFIKCVPRDFIFCYC